MLKKIVFAAITLIATSGFSYAAVDLNKADQAALDSVKGIGPKMSRTILDERKKGGDFKDWADFEKRVKGVGEKSSDKFSQEGLTINGKSKSKADSSKHAQAAKAEAKNMKPEAKAAAKDVKQEATEIKKEAKANAKEAKK